MQRFSIRNIETLTGIKAHTWRIWEQRFTFFKAPRKDGKQRIYENEDLQRLLCVAFLYHNGWKISKIATLSWEEINAAAEGIAMADAKVSSYVQKLLQAALEFNEAAFLQTLNGLVATIGLERTVVDVCYPYLQCVGLLWDTNRVIPAQEHFSSYLIQNRVISETETYSVIQNGPPEIALFCPENEYHELPLLYLNYLLRKNGWRVLYLGPDTKLTDLQEAVRVTGIHSLYLHLITNFTGLHIDDYLETLRKSFPDKRIVASGKGIEKAERNFVNVRLLRRDDEIHRFIAEKV